MHIEKPDKRIATEVFPDILRIKQSSMCAGPDKCGLLYCSIIQWSVTCNNSARKVWEITTCQTNCSPTYGVSEFSSASSPHLLVLPGLDRSQKTHPPKRRDSEPLNKTTVCCAVNGHKITNTLNISHSSLGDKSSSDCASSSPLCEYFALSRIIPMWQLSSQNSSTLSFKRQRETFISSAYRLSHAYMTLVYCCQAKIPLVIQFSVLLFFM